jgi:hypothetical protein
MRQPCGGTSMSARFLIAAATAFALAVVLPLSAQKPVVSTVEVSTVEVVGCLDGSVLTETTLNHVPKGRETTNVAQRWRLSASKEVMRQLREQATHELRVIGTTDSKQRSRRVLERPVGKRGTAYVGARSKQRDRDLPMHEPVLHVEGFAPTSNVCH